MSNVDPRGVMLYPQEDGKLVEIPEEHAAVLALYRDRMPVVFEVQEFGPPMFYPLIDVDAEPYGTEQPGALENAAARTAAVLKRRRLGEDPPAPDLERLAVAAVRAHVADMADFGAGCAFGEGQAAELREARSAATRAGQSLRKVIERSVRDAVADTTNAVHAASASSPTGAQPTEQNGDQS
ncbi:hypothetical protein ACIQWB_35385 [Streptomyces olivaceus]|uniref:hypothetical protein n=1 Tax=Streptomyces olivaceus TaxID=47716 RepID=UPI00381E87EC